MDAIIGFFTSLDPLGVLFLAGSLLSLWAVAYVLVDDLDLGAASHEGAPAEEMPVEETPATDAASAGHATPIPDVAPGVPTPAGGPAGPAGAAGSAQEPPIGPTPVHPRGGRRAA